MTEDEQKLQSILVGTNLAVRIESGAEVIFFVNQWGVEMKLTATLLRKGKEELLHAILMLFAAGAEKITWRDESESDLVTGVVLPPGGETECR